MDARCKHSDRLSAYLDSRLSSKESAQLAAHVKDCPVCGKLLEQMQRLSAMASASLPDFDDAILTDLETGIQEKLKTLEQPTVGKPRVIPIWYRYAAVAASLAIVFLAGRMAFREAGEPLPGAKSKGLVPEIKQVSPALSPTVTEESSDAREKKAPPFPPQAGSAPLIVGETTSVKGVQKGVMMKEEPPAETVVSESAVTDQAVPPATMPAQETFGLPIPAPAQPTLTGVIEETTGVQVRPPLGEKTVSGVQPPSSLEKNIAAPPQGAKDKAAPPPADQGAAVVTPLVEGAGQEAEKSTLSIADTGVVLKDVDSLEAFYHALISAPPTSRTDALMSRAQKATQQVSPLQVFVDSLESLAEPVQPYQKIERLYLLMLSSYDNYRENGQVEYLDRAVAHRDVLLTLIKEQLDRAGHNDALQRWREKVERFRLEK
jgi:hypothetical protein